MHACVFVKGPPHTVGSPDTSVRVCVCVPPPHVTEQALQADQDE